MAMTLRSISAIAQRAQIFWADGAAGATPFPANYFDGWASSAFMHPPRLLPAHQGGLSILSLGGRFARSRPRPCCAYATEKGLSLVRPPLTLTLHSVRGFRMENGHVRALAEGNCPRSDRGPLGLGAPLARHGRRRFGPFGRTRTRRRERRPLRSSRPRRRPPSFLRPAFFLLLLHSMPIRSDRRFSGISLRHSERSRFFIPGRRDRSRRRFSDRGDIMAGGLDQFLVAARPAAHFFDPIAASPRGVAISQRDLPLGL
jgi:hypothetical protein